MGGAGDFPLRCGFRVRPLALPFLHKFVRLFFLTTVIERRILETGLVLQEAMRRLSQNDFDLLLLGTGQQPFRKQDDILSGQVRMPDMVRAEFRIRDQKHVLAEDRIYHLRWDSHQRLRQEIDDGEIVGPDKLVSLREQFELGVECHEASLVRQIPNPQPLSMPAESEYSKFNGPINCKLFSRWRSKSRSREDLEALFTHRKISTRGN